MSKFQLYTYDLWGNDEDGYTINDYYRQSDTFEIKEKMTDSEIIALIDFTNPETIQIDNNCSDESHIYFMDENHKPICELREVN